MDSQKDSKANTVLLISIAVTVLFWLETFIVGSLEAGQGYSQIEHPISLLMLAAPPLGLIHRIAFVLLGLAMVGFAYGLRRNAPENSRATTALFGLLLLHGVGRLGEAIFLWDPSAPNSITSTLHQVVGVAGIVAMIPVSFLAANSIANSPSASTVSKISIAFGILFLLLFLLGVVLSILAVGLGQRVGFVLWYAWLIFFSFRSRDLVDQSA